MSILKLKVTQDNDNSFFHTQRPFYLHSTQCFIYSLVLKVLHMKIPPSAYVDLIKCTVSLWLLQVGVPLKVLCSYCGRSNRACSSCRVPSKVLNLAVATAVLHYTSPTLPVRKNPDVYLLSPVITAWVKRRGSIPA